MSSVVTPVLRDNAAAFSIEVTDDDRIIVSANPTITFLDVVDPAGKLLLRTFSTVEAASFKREYDSLRVPGAKSTTIETREATLLAT